MEVKVYPNTSNNSCITPKGTVGRLVPNRPKNRVSVNAGIEQRLNSRSCHGMELEHTDGTPATYRWCQRRTRAAMVLPSDPDGGHQLLKTRHSAYH